MEPSMAEHPERGRRPRFFRLPASRKRVRRTVDAELRFHLEERIAELVQQGFTRADAEVEAIDQATVRERGVAESVSGLARDLRHVVRGLRRRPLFTAIVVLTLALGIGANTAMFSFVDAVLLRPISVPWLDRMVAVRRAVEGVEGLDNTEMSPPETMDLAHRTDLFDATAGVSNTTLNLESSGDPQRVLTARTLGDFFTIFGSRPLLGSIYRPADSENGNFRRAVLSHRLWRQTFGGDSSIVGRSIQLSGRTFEVVGVMPRSFAYPRTADLWVPFQYDSIWKTRRGTWIMSPIARVRIGVADAQLRAGLKAEAERWGGGSGSAHRLFTVRFVDYIAGQLERVLIVLMGAVVLLLLIGCANVASLQLVRAAERGRELAVRATLGAGRWSIARQLLLESLVLAVIGGVFGVAIGAFAVRELSRWGVAQYELLEGVTLNGTVLVFATAVTVLAALLFGTYPAFRAARVDLHSALKDSMRGTSAGLSRGRFLQGSVVVQTALTLVLLLGSGLMIRSLAELIATDPGFRTDHLTTMKLVLPPARYGKAEPRIAFHEALVARLRTLPGIQASATAFGLPFAGDDNSSLFTIVGRPQRDGEPERHARMWFVGGDYFRVLGIAVKRGRVFGPQDLPYGKGMAAAVIDETLARQFFGNEDPIGQTINQGPDAVIIGVVANVKHGDLTEADKASVYYYFPQAPWGLATVTVILRSTLPLASVAAMARRAVQEIDPLLPVYDIAPMAERIDRSLGNRRLAMTVLTGFAALSLGLAILGIYGVISYTTSQRTHEIGIRMALGARPGDVLRMVVGSGVQLAGVGLVVGVMVFLAVGRAMSALVYGVGMHDRLTMLAGIAVLAIVAVFASYIPARRAARVGPGIALRSE
jgi:predicted permease